jgi:tetratricopeptide (TPR) repeat protein
LRAANLTQASPHLLLVRGDVELAAGRLGEAKKLYRRALRANPRFTEALVALAKVELAEKNPAGARRWLARARKLDPENPLLQSLQEELLNKNPEEK